MVLCDAAFAHFTSCHATRVYTLRHRYKAARGVLLGIWEADVAYVINQHVEKRAQQIAMHQGRWATKS